MKKKNILAFLLAFAMAFVFTACGGNENIDNGDTTAINNSEVVTVEAGVEADVKNDAVTSSDEETAPESDELVTKKKNTVSENDPKPNQPVNTGNGLNSTDAKAVLDFYKAAVEKTGSIDAKQHMSIASINFTPRNSFEKGLLALFNGDATAALKAHSTARYDIPGHYQALETSDLNSANALISDNYTIVTLNVKSQEDNEDISDNSLGPVGHAVGTIGDISQVFEAIPAIKVDHSRGDITLRYDNCKVVVKINNETGKIEKGIWSYTVNVTLTDIYAIFPGSDELRLTNMGGSVDFDVKTNDCKRR